MNVTPPGVRHGRAHRRRYASGRPRSARSGWLGRVPRRVPSVVIVGLGAAASVLLTPASGDPVALAAQAQPSPDATPFGGTKTVGTLFQNVDGKLTHFCTASVVNSPGKNLLITAAHCLEGRSLTPLGTITFAADYHDGVFPYGRWVVREAVVDSAWAKSHDPDDDVAFLVVGQPGRQLQKFTGANALVTKARLPQTVQVVGYPDVSNLPITCTRTARAFTKDHLHQMVFDCDGYTVGTSGGPWLVNVSPKSGDGNVVGVIGGYQQGGDTADVSYSAQFLANVAALYKTAVKTAAG
jgi:V8-like Glu-specific endopeptidase